MKRKAFWVYLIVAVSVVVCAAFAYRGRGIRGAGTTKVLVTVVADLVKGHPRKTIGDGDRTYPLWDFNADSIIDGYPGFETGWTDAERHAAEKLGYKGFVAELRPPLTASSIDSQGHILDQWGNPLHIRFSDTAYRPSWFGVWSDGPDGISGTEDDITSW